MLISSMRTSQATNTTGRCSNPTCGTPLRAPRSGARATHPLHWPVPSPLSPLASRAASAGSRAAALQAEDVATPHSGYHFDGTPRRFFEGWYWKVYMPDEDDSFALIYSVEDPFRRQQHSGVGAQVMGPGDGYICQFSPDTRGFWAERNRLELGYSFEGQGGPAVPRRLASKDEFNRTVSTGFQASSTFHQGRLTAHERGTAGPPMSTVGSCAWEFTLQPLSGWGDTQAGGQKPTAGWLSVLSVFEPHWQILMSHGLASGWLEWGGKRLAFTDAPTYAEKNWGGGFPSKWIWVQCNSFADHPGVSLTAVGARRQLLLGLPGLEEDVGLIGVHFQGKFVEMVPWNGAVEWNVDPWGRWEVKARNANYEAVVEASTHAPGCRLRAPTITAGLAPFCKDTFTGTCRLRLWELDATGVRRSEKPVLDATSSSAALEVGGGPWWAPWAATADMKEPLRTLVQLPIDVGAAARLAPPWLRPPGV